MPCCSAVGCSNRHDKGFRLFRFPSDPIRRNIWIANTKRDSWVPTRCSLLCEAHFDESQFERNRLDGRKLLRPFAIPKIFPRRPTQDSSNLPAIKHTSSKVKGSCVATDADGKSGEAISRRVTRSTKLNKGCENASDHRREGLPSSGGDNAGSKRPRLEVIRLGDVAVTRQATIPPIEPSLSSHENSRDSWCGDVKNPVVGTMDGEETETMLSDRERIIKHRYECCRLCLQRSEELTDVFKGTRLGLVVREAVKDLLQFEVVREGGSPWQVCYLCIQKLSDFRDFKDRCVETKDLWEDCFERKEGITTMNNHIKNEPENEEDIDTMEDVRNLQGSAFYEGENIEAHTFAEGALISPQPSMSNGVNTIKEEIVIPDGNASNGLDMENFDIYEDCPLETIIKEEDNCETKHIPSGEDMRLDINSAKVEGGDRESDLIPMNTVWIKTEYVTETSRTWDKGKENMTNVQVKGANEGAGPKSEEPLVLVLKGGGVEPCPLPEASPEAGIGVEVYRKISGEVLKEGPLDKGD